MIRKAIFAAGAFAIAFGAPGLSRAEEQPAAQQSAAAPAPEAAAVNPASEPLAAPAAAPAAPQAGAPAPAAPEAEALRKALSGLPEGKSDEERNERAALLAFYEARAYAPLWLASPGAGAPKTDALAAEIKRSEEWGLNPNDFPLPPADAQPAAYETQVSQAILKYGRYARGGRIMAPSEQLNSYLDRRPQLLAPKAILEGVAAADDAAAYLRGLNPQHPQFEKLRQKYLAVLARGNSREGVSANPRSSSPEGGRATKKQSAEAKRLLANMEQWRWMPADMGSVYIWNNLPDFTQRVVKDGKTVREVRIVAGEKDKQTPIFSRNLRKITFRPTWIVPDSIKVRELWPSLLRGGGLMREWQLELRAKDGKFVDWRRINWANTNILDYDVIQPNGPKTVLGKVKFSFPSQHTVFMHDTRAVDKWMFNVASRTYSHGCMRVADPVGLAKIALREDKGWTPAQTEDALYKGPLNNEIVIERRIPVHMTYFTVLADERGELRTYPDVYGHERRITLALEGKWDKIVKGRNHLAPVEVDLSAASRRLDPDEEQTEPRRHRHYSGRYWSRAGGAFGDFFWGD